MKLRAKIFRHLVLIATIPSLILAVSAYFLLDATLSQTNVWLASSTPDRTINALRLAESRLQAAAKATMSASGTQDRLRLLDWSLMGDSLAMPDAVRESLPAGHDSLLCAACKEPGPVRLLVDGAVVVGYARDSAGGILAGGFVLGEEYVSGFQAATANLGDSRNQQNLFPAFIVFQAIIGIIIFIGAVSLAYWLSRRLSRSVTIPLEELAVGVASIGRGKRLPVFTKAETDEVQNLAASFTSMAAELDENRKKLMAAERVQAWQEFARRMAHELKNPLTPISLSLYRIKKKLQDSGEYDRFADSVDAISAEVAHLERLASDYSSLAKLPEPKMVEFDFKQVCDEVVALHAVQLESFNFSHSCEDEKILLSGDPDRLREVLINVLKNAIDFCLPNGTITFIVRTTGDKILIRVANDVKNVNEVDIKKARIPYYTTRKGGSGLGLAVSDKILMDHGGNLTLQIVDSSAVIAIELPRR